MDAIDLAEMSFEPPKKKRRRRWAKRPTDPNHDANAFLSVRDVQLIVRELEYHAKQIAGLRGLASEHRRVQRLIAKLRAVTWSPRPMRGA